MTVAALEVAFLGVLYLLAGRRLWSRYVLLAAAVLAPAAYLLWRVSDTLVLTTSSVTVSVALVLSECIGSAYQMLWTVLMRKPGRPLPDVWPLDLPPPTVDVFVTAHDEPLDMLRRTLTGCADIRHPADLLTIHIVDGGNRASVRRLARHLGIGYLAGSANAGTLNHALGQTSGSLILLLDAGTRPEPHIVERMIAQFRDPMMGFVQAPLTFSRLDAHRQAPTVHMAILSEQECILDEMLAVQDRSKAALFAGGSAMFSRAALESIDGFSRGGIAGDLSTGLLVQRRGYRSALIDGVVATAPPAESFRAALHQRIGWARGYIWSWKNHRPLRLKQLSMWQRLAYLAGLLHGYACLKKLIYTLTPILCLNLGLVAWHATPAQLMIVWLPALVGGNLALRTIGGQRRTPFWSHAYDSAVMCPLAWTVVAETVRLPPARSRAARDEGARGRDGIVLSAFVPLLLLCVLTVTGIGQGLMTLNAHFSLATLSSISANIIWAGYNMSGLVVGLLISFDRLQPAHGECSSWTPLRDFTRSAMNLVRRGKPARQAIASRLSRPGSAPVRHLEYEPVYATND